MAWTFVSASATVTGSNPALTLPDGWATGNLLVAYSTTSANAPTMSTAGWTLISGTGTTSSPPVFYKIATAGETNPTMNITGTTGVAVILCYANIIDFNVGGVVRNNSGLTSTLATNSLTTTQPSALVISFFATGNVLRTLTPPASTNLRVLSQPTAAFNGMCIVDEFDATAGPTTARTLTASANTFILCIAESFYSPNYATNGNFFFNMM